MSKTPPCSPRPAVITHAVTDGPLLIHYAGSKPFRANIAREDFKPSRDAYFCEGSLVEPEWEGDTANIPRRKRSDGRDNGRASSEALLLKQTAKRPIHHGRKISSTAVQIRARKHSERDGMAVELLTKFATDYKVKIHSPIGNNPDRWGIRHGEEIVVPGKFGEITEAEQRPLLDDGSLDPTKSTRHGTLQIRLTAVPRHADVNKALNGRAKEAEEGGMVLYQRNGYETIWGFDPENRMQCELAIKLVAPRRKKSRILTDTQKTALRVRLAAARGSGGPSAGCVECLVSCPNPHVGGRTATNQPSDGGLPVQEFLRQIGASFGSQ